MSRQLALPVICLFWAIGPAVSVAQDSVNPGVGASVSADREGFRSIDQDIQDLKKEFLDLNQDMVELEEELLFPATSQTAFFVALDVGDYFTLDSINLKINGKIVANYLYKSREVDSLQRGGVHRLHMANLEAGNHELVAEFIGKGANARDYRRESTMTLTKSSGAKYVTFEITDRMQNQQPQVVIRDWE